MSKPAPTCYRTTNWSDYSAALRKRGSLLIWLDKEMAWHAPHGWRPGRPHVFSDAAIQFCLSIKVLSKLPLRGALDDEDAEPDRWIGRLRVGAHSIANGVRGCVARLVERGAEPCRQEPRDDGHTGRREPKAGRKCQTFAEKRQIRPKRGSAMSRKRKYIRELNGAQGRNRTTDTRIFNPLLYP